MSKPMLYAGRRELGPCRVPSDSSASVTHAGGMTPLLRVRGSCCQSTTACDETLQTSLRAVTGAGPVDKSARWSELGLRQVQAVGTHSSAQPSTKKTKLRVYSGVAVTDQQAVGAVSWRKYSLDTLVTSSPDSKVRRKSPASSLRAPFQH